MDVIKDDLIEQEQERDRDVQPLKNELQAEFGKRVKEIRRHLSIAQKEFALQLGISGSYLSEIESGKIKPGFDFFSKCVNTFKISPLYLLIGDSPIFFDADPKQIPSTFRENSGKIQEMFWYMEHSDMVRHAMIEYFIRYSLQNKDLIKNELKSKDIKKP